MKKKKYRAFILIPHNNKFENIFQKIIKKALEENDFIVKRAKDIQNIQSILKDIVNSIINADLVIADLTDSNPNVLYELGIAHTAQSPTILITQKIDELPFDLKNYRVVPYSTEFNQINILYTTLIGLSKSIMVGEAEYGNPVMDYLEKNTLIELKSKLEPIDERKDGEIHIAHKDISDFVSYGIKSMENIQKVMENITIYTREYSKELLVLANKKIHFEKIGDIGSVDELFLKSSFLMKNFAENIRGELPSFQIYWSSFRDDVTGLIKASKVETLEDKKNVSDFLKRIEELKKALNYAINSTSGLIRSTKQSYSLSKELSRTGPELVSTLNLLISNLEIGNIFTENIIDLIKDEF